MSLMPVYYTSNNTKKRKTRKKSQKQLRAEQNHQAFIDRMKRNSVNGSTTASKPVGAGSIPASSANLISFLPHSVSLISFTLYLEKSTECI